MLREDAWLGATSVHSRDPRVPALLRSLRELCDANPALRLVINHFDPNASSRVKARPATDRIQVSWVPGMKGLFWKTVLTPLRTSTYRVVWLFDSDMAVHPGVLPLGAIDVPFPTKSREWNAAHGGTQGSLCTGPFSWCGGCPPMANQNCRRCTGAAPLPAAGAVLYCTGRTKRRGT